MTVTLYKTSDKPNTIKKKLTAVKTLTCQVLEPFSLTNPILKLAHDDDILNANFAVITAFKRSYFIKDIKIENGFFIVELEVDVLESFKSDILNYNGIIERQEFDYNLMLEDGEIKAYSKSVINYKKFPYTPFSHTIEGTAVPYFVMITTADT